MNTNMLYFTSVSSAELIKALNTWRSASSNAGVLALLPEAEKDSVPMLQSLCEQHGISLVGGIFPALIKNGQFVNKGVWLLHLDRMPYVALHDNLQAGAEGAAQAAKEIAAGVRAQLRDAQVPATLFMLFDSLVPNISTMLDELYLQLANRVHYAGSNAGSETFQPMPCLFDGNRIIQSGVLVILLTPHHGAILEHGYCVPPQTMTATSTEGNRIVQIDWRPAFEVYRELVKSRFDVEITRENFYQYGVHFPFGIVRANQSVVVRIPVALGEDGSLFCIGEVAPHAVLALLDAPAVDSTHTLDALAQGLAGQGGGSADRDVLLFYCAGRRLHLGMDAATAELGIFMQRTRAAQVAGALSLGEIGGTTQWDYPLFHNATLVASLW